MVGDIDTAWSLSERGLSDVVWFPCNTSSEDVRMEAGTRDNEEYRQISLSWRGKLQYIMRSWTGSARFVKKLKSKTCRITKFNWMNFCSSSMDIYLVSCIGTSPQCIEKVCIVRRFLRIYQEENQLKKIETPPCHLFQHQCKPFLCSALSLWRPNYLICAPNNLIKIEWFVGVGFTRSLALLSYYSSYYTHFISKTLKYFFLQKMHHTKLNLWLLIWYH